MTYLEQYPKTVTYFTNLLHDKQHLIDVEKDDYHKVCILRKFFSEASEEFLNAEAPFTELKDFLFSLMSYDDKKEQMQDVISYLYDFFRDELYKIWDEAKDKFEIDNFKKSA